MGGLLVLLVLLVGGLLACAIADRVRLPGPMTWQHSVVFDGAVEPDDAGVARRLDRHRRMRQADAQMLAAARAATLGLRHRPGIDPTAVDRILARLDPRTAGLPSTARQQP
jgi:hypothetical protein